MLDGRPASHGRARPARRRWARPPPHGRQPWVTCGARAARGLGRADRSALRHRSDGAGTTSTTSPPRRRSLAPSGTAGRLALPVATLHRPGDAARTAGRDAPRPRRVPRARRSSRRAPRPTGRASAPGRTRPQAVASARASRWTTRYAVRAGARPGPCRASAPLLTPSVRHHRPQRWSPPACAPRRSRPSDPAARLAARAWAQAEVDVPSWVHPETCSGWTSTTSRTQSTAEARGLVTRIDGALSTRRSVAPTRRTIVHHGFYFYSPVQWALFQALRPGPRRRPGLHRPRRRRQSCVLHLALLLPVRVADADPRPGPGRTRGHPGGTRFRGVLTGAEPGRRTRSGWSSAAAPPSSCGCGAPRPPTARRRRPATRPLPSRSRGTRAVGSAGRAGRRRRARPHRACRSSRRQLPARAARVHHPGRRRGGHLPADPGGPARHGR